MDPFCCFLYAPSLSLELILRSACFLNQNGVCADGVFREKVPSASVGPVPSLSQKLYLVITFKTIAVKI